MSQRIGQEWEKRQQAESPWQKIASQIPGTKEWGERMEGNYRNLYKRYQEEKIQPMNAMQGLFHYVFGGGKPVKIPFEQVYTSQMANIENFPITKNILLKRNEGIYKINDKRSILTKGLNNRAFLGQITLELKGNLFISNKKYHFKGFLSAKTDTYDFDLGKNRGLMAEFSTIVGSFIPGKPYDIFIIGEKKITQEGDY